MNLKIILSSHCSSGLDSRRLRASIWAGVEGIAWGSVVIGCGGPSDSLRGLMRRFATAAPAGAGGRHRARGGWLCMPLTATTLAPSMWIRALQFVFFDVQRHITLSRSFDSSQKGNVFTIIITLPRRDFRNFIPVKDYGVIRKDIAPWERKLTQIIKVTLKIKCEEIKRAVLKYNLIWFHKTYPVHEPKNLNFLKC